MEAALPSLRQRSALYPYRYYLVALGVILFDQMVKLWVRFTMDLGESHAVIGNTFKINYVLNDGAAFGLTLPDIMRVFGVDMSPETGKRILTIFSIFAVILILYFLRLTQKQKSPMPFFVALILGGALGNIVDRVFYGVWFRGMVNDPQCMGLMHGCVVDMFFVDLGTWKILGREMMLFPVFNIADAAITIGIGAIFIFQRRFHRIAERNEQQPTSSPIETQSPENQATPDLPEPQTPATPET